MSSPTAKPVSDEEVENTRIVGARIQSEILQRLEEVKQVHTAAFMGASPRTVSRVIDHLTYLCQLLAAIGLEVAPVGAVVVDQDDQLALKRMAFNYLKIDLEKSGAFRRRQGHGASYQGVTDS